jgi:hypothetical protein
MYSTYVQKNGGYLLVSDRRPSVCEEGWRSEQDSCHPRPHICPTEDGSGSEAFCYFTTLIICMDPIFSSGSDYFLQQAKNEKTFISTVF